MNLSKFVNSDTGKYMMSILLGLGLSTLFRSVCKGKSCKVVKAPPLDEIDNQIYKFDGKCYNMERSAVKCNKNKQIFEFA